MTGSGTRTPGPGVAGPPDRSLAAILRTGPFEAALHAAISARGLPLDRLRTRLAERGLRVGITTLSYWQRGLRRPERPESLRAVAALEEILGLPEHSLTVLLGPPRPRGSAVRPAPQFTEIIESAPALDTLLAELDSPAAGKVQVVSQYDAVVVGARRQLESVTTMQVVSARLDGVDRALVIYTVEPGHDVRSVHFEAIDSCRLGRVRRHDAAGALVAEMLFDRGLRVGETHLMSYRLVAKGDAETREHVVGFRLPAGSYVLGIRFDPAALPVHGHRFRARASGGPEEDRVAMTLDSDHRVHMVYSNFGPGAVGMRWDWR